MRFSYLIGLAFPSIDLVAALPKNVCSTTTSFTSGGWFQPIAVCAGARSQLTQFTQASLETCVSGLNPVAFGGPAIPGLLLTHLRDASRDATHACTTCVVNLANSLVDLFEYEYVRGLCIGGSSGAWLWTYNDVITALCASALRVAVDAFNACADNGFEIVSGSALSRCTVSEFKDLQTNFDVYETIAPIAMTNGGPAIARNYVYEFAGLTDAVAALSAPCATALDNFVDGLGTMTSGVSTNCWAIGFTPVADPLNGSCVADTIMTGLLSAFTTNSDGYVLSTVESTHCTEAVDISLINDTLRPYQALTKCATETNLANRKACVSVLNGVFDIVDANLDCYLCFLNYMEDVSVDGAMLADCLVDPSKPICSLVGNSMNGPLYKFAMCSGFEMNTDVTKCTTVEKNLLGAPFSSYTQLVTCGLFATASERLACLANVHTLYDMQDSTSGCLSCYWAFIEDVQAMNAVNANLGLVCRNPFQSACKTALTGTGKPLDRFYECSGIRLVVDSGITCSTTQFETLTDINLPFESVVSFAFTSATMTEAIYDFDTYLTAEMDARSLEWTDIPCVSCFYDLIRSGFSLPLAAKEICYADVGSDECSFVYGVGLETFFACSGHAVRFNDDASTTTAPISEETVTTEAPATTTKGVCLVSAMVSIVAVLLN